jgi:phage baseplate assembly protein W
MATSAYLRGLKYPFVKGTQALPAPVTDDELVKQSILQILLTGRGERVMRPQFGCNLQAFVFESNNELLEQLLRTEIAAAIGKFEPRALLQNIQIERQDNNVQITIVYAVVATRTLDTLQVNVPVAGP